MNLARRQYGLLSRAQALGAGMTTLQIRHRLDSGRWELDHRKVYRLAPVPDTWHQRLLSACLAGGPGTAASHRSAGELWQLDAVPAGLIEITTPRRIERPPLIAHRSSLAEWEIVTRRDIPVTDPARTLFDLASVMTRRELERAFESAIRRRLIDVTSMAERLERRARSGRTGVRVWRELLAARDPRLQPTESDFETLLHQVTDRFGLPRPARQVTITDDQGRFVKRVDFAYPEARLVIEADSIEFHSDPEAIRRDRLQTRQLVTLGWTVLRVTHWEVTHEPEDLADSIFTILRRLNADKPHGAPSESG